MTETADAVSKAIAAEAEANDNVQAAQAEESQNAALSLDLLSEAITKEREGLDKLEEGIHLIQQALDERRRGLDQQEELLTRLIKGSRS